MSVDVIADALAAGRRELELAWATENDQQVALTRVEQYARDPLLWIAETPVWVASKFAGSGRSRPAIFEPFPDQVGTIADWIDLDHLARTGGVRFRNVIVEKSRQIGETVGLAVAVTWALHYHRVSLFAIHQKLPKIDDGGTRNTWESFFGKIRYIDARLGSPNGIPDLAARAQVPGLGDFVFRTKPSKIENVRSGAIIVGEGQVDDPGRGGTYDGVVGDEAAFLEHGEKIHAALDEACPEGKIYLSTVNGDSNVHARLADEKPAGWRYRRNHWSTHPVYSVGLHVAAALDPQTRKTLEPGLPDCPLCAGTRQGLTWTSSDPIAHRYPGRLTSPWYDARVIGKTDEQVANELDIDRERALGGRVLPEFSTDVHVIAGGIPFDPALEHKLELAWDFGLDATAIVICQDAPDEDRVIGLLEMGDLHRTTATPETVSARLRDYLAELGYPAARLTPEWTRRIVGWGDPAGGARSLDTGRPLISAYARLGWTIRKPPPNLTRRAETSISAVKRMLLGSPKPVRVCGLNAAEFARHARNNTWPTDESGRRRIGSTVPHDDEHNHAMRAYAYRIVAKYPPATISEQTAGDEWDDPVERRHGSHGLPGYGSTL